MTDADGDEIYIDLDQAERRMMVLALNEYSGLAKKGSELLPPVVGRSNDKDWSRYYIRLLNTIEIAEPLTDLNWARALFLTEASFGSELVGAGSEWDIGQSGDDTNIPALRSLQDKIGTAERSRLLQENVAFPVPEEQTVETRRRLHSNGDPIELDDDQRRFMCTAIGAYRQSPRHGFSVLAPLVGQPTFEMWVTYTAELHRALVAHEDLVDLDWMRALFLAEIGFTSVLVGFGSQFRGADRQGIKILRSLQLGMGTYERYMLFRESATYRWIERNDD
jgi:hypothetical protein